MCPRGRSYKDHCGNDCTCYESTGAVFCNEKRRCQAVAMPQTFGTTLGTTTTPPSPPRPPPPRLPPPIPEINGNRFTKRVRFSIKRVKYDEFGLKFSIFELAGRIIWSNGTISGRRPDKFSHATHK